MTIARCVSPVAVAIQVVGASDVGRNVLGAAYVLGMLPITRVVPPVHASGAGAGLALAVAVSVPWSTTCWPSGTSLASPAAGITVASPPRRVMNVVP